MFPIQDLSVADFAFGGAGVGIHKLLPAEADIPQEYTRGYHHPRVKLVEMWMFFGLKNIKSVPREGVDEEKAMRHLGTVMGSYAPSHEYKMAGVAYLIDQWFESFEAEPAKTREELRREEGW